MGDAPNIEFSMGRGNNYREPRRRGFDDDQPPADRGFGGGAGGGFAGGGGFSRPLPSPATSDAARNSGSVRTTPSTAVAAAENAGLTADGVVPVGLRSTRAS